MAAFRFEGRSTWQERIAKREYCVVEDVVFDDSRPWRRTRKIERGFRDIDGPGSPGEILVECEEREVRAEKLAQVQFQLDAVFDADQLIDNLTLAGRITFLREPDRSPKSSQYAGGQDLKLTNFTLECADNWLDHQRRGAFTVVEKACIDPAKWNYRFRGNAYVIGGIPILNDLDDMIRTHRTKKQALCSVQCGWNLHGNLGIANLHGRTENPV